MTILRSASWFLVLILLVVSAAEAAPEDRFESARLGVAPSSYHGMSLERGTAVITDEGYGYADFAYVLRDQDDRPKRTVTVAAYWWDQVRGEQTQRESGKRLHPKASAGGSSAGMFSLTHQINVRVSSSDPASYAPSKALPLAEQIATGLEARALPRDRHMAAFRPPARVGRYYLRYSITFGFNERKGTGSAEFVFSVPSADVHHRKITPQWRIKVYVMWQEDPAREARDERRWEMDGPERRSQEEGDLKTGLLVYSETHRAFLVVSGEHVDPTGQRGLTHGFENEQHRAEGRQLGMQFLDVAVKQFAMSKVPEEEAEPEVEQPNIETIDVFDANPIYTGGMPVDDISNPAELLTTLKTKRVGVCADGVSEVVLRVAVEKPGRVDLSVGKHMGKVDMIAGGRTVPDPEADVDEEGDPKRHFAFAHYIPPDTFPPSPDRAPGHDPRIGGIVAYRDLPVTAKYAPAIRDVEDVEETFRLKIVRPPVLLVHGTFDNPDQCWKQAAPIEDRRYGTPSMYEALTELGFAVFLVDFRDTNGSTQGNPKESSFGHNCRVLWANPDGIYDALYQFREMLDIATTQVDVVGHSLGGLIPRLWASEGYNPRGRGGGVRVSRDGTFGYKRVDNFEKGDIHRLITICTPHLGSDLGHMALVFQTADKPLWKEFTGVDWLEDMAIHVAGVFGYAVTDVVLDQLPHLPTMPNGALQRIGATEVPSHAIVGWARAPDLRDFGGSYEKGQYYGLMWLLHGSTDVVREFLRIRGQGHDFERILGEAFTFEAEHRDPGANITDSWMFHELSTRDQYVLEKLMRAAIFGNTQNDMVVRVESQIGGLPIKHATQLPGILHSYATMYPEVQRSVIKLLNGSQREFHRAGFPAPSPMRNVEPFTVKQDPVARAKAIATSGYVPSHAEALSLIAMEEDVVILARPVNLNSTPLIATHNATKDMHVKGKSSSWGPQKGFIAVEQRFSKLHFAKKDREKDIKKFDGKVESCLAEGRAKQVPLVRDVGGVRCEVLVVKGIKDAEKAIVLKDESGAYHGWKNGRLETFDPRNGPAPLEIDAAEIERRGTRPMRILADRNTEIPLTADYDMLAFASRFEPQTPLDDPEMGGIRPYQVELVRKMNNEVRVRANYIGGDVTHHGPENLYGDSPGPDYPITAYEPSGYIITIREGRVGRSDYWLKRYYHHLKARDWFILVNRAWLWGEYDPIQWPGIGFFPNDRPKPKKGEQSNPFDSDEGDEHPRLLPAADGEG